MHEDKCVLKIRFFLPALKKIQELRNIWLQIPYGPSPNFAAQAEFTGSWN